MSEARHSAENPLVGKVMGGRFRLDAVIGTGAMGTVYRAKHLALERQVAVKVLHAHLRSDDTFVTRFHREARAASRLDHGNIMRVIDYGDDEGPDEITKGRLFIAMELLEGTDLFQVIHDSFPLKTERIVNIMRQLLGAVAAAHDAGIIHRDLKPENVMVRKVRDDDGDEIDVVKVCDFGIAKMTERTETSYDDGRKLSVHGLLVGTPEYMSPEQARGETLDARSDVYSVGVMLYQMLVGKLPFEGSQPLDVALKQLADVPEPPHMRAENVDPLLEAICLKALEKAPDARYQSAREMRTALRSAVSGRSTAEMSGAYSSLVPPSARSSDAPRGDFPSSGEALIAAPSSSHPRASGIDTPLSTERDAPGRMNSEPSSPMPTRKHTPLVIPVLGAAAAVAVGYFALRGGATSTPASDAPRRASSMPPSESVQSATLQQSVPASAAAIELTPPKALMDAAATTVAPVRSVSTVPNVASVTTSGSAHVARQVRPQPVMPTAATVRSATPQSSAPPLPSVPAPKPSATERTTPAEPLPSAAPQPTIPQPLPEGPDGPH